MTEAILEMCRRDNLDPVLILVGAPHPDDPRPVSILLNV
jgi:hypothetical protein